ADVPEGSGRGEEEHEEGEGPPVDPLLNQLPRPLPLDEEDDAGREERGADEHHVLLQVERALDQLVPEETGDRPHKEERGQKDALLLGLSALWTGGSHFTRRGPLLLERVLKERHRLLEEDEGEEDGDHPSDDGDGGRPAEEVGEGEAGP